MGWQVPVRTDDTHGSARIEGIEVREMVRRFGEGQVAVVAGFQGIDPQGRITTLGRGGSDTSAVALAAALQAERCDIYTDVDGVYTTDPRIVAKARKLDRITYEEMQIGSAPCRERVCQYVLISVVAVSLKKKKYPQPTKNTNP